MKEDQMPSFGWFKRLFQRPATGRNDHVTGVAGGWEADAEARAAAIRIPPASAPNPQTIDETFESHVERAQNAFAEKDADMVRSKAIKASMRSAMKAARLWPRAHVAAMKLKSFGNTIKGLEETVRRVLNALGPLAYRSVGRWQYVLIKTSLIAADAAGLTLVFSLAFDMPYGLAAIWSGAIALGLVYGPAALAEERKRAAQRGGVGNLSSVDPRTHAYIKLLAHEVEATRGLRVVGSTAGLLFAGSGVAVGGLRAMETGNAFAVVALAALTIVPLMTSALVAWGHASLFADVMEHAERRLSAALKARPRTHALGRYFRCVTKVKAILDEAELAARARRVLGKALSAVTESANPEAFGHGRRRKTARSDESRDESEPKAGTVAAFTGLWNLDAVTDSSAASASEPDGASGAKDDGGAVDDAKTDDDERPPEVA